MEKLKKFFTKYFKRVMRGFDNLMSGLDAIITSAGTILLMIFTLPLWLLGGNDDSDDAETATDEESMTPISLTIKDNRIVGASISPADYLSLLDDSEEEHNERTS